MSSRVLRRLASWIALVAIVAVTFMPTLTRLVLPAGDGVDVCSADIERRSGPADGDSHALSHCPYCALHADLALPPPPAVGVVAVTVAFRARPVAFLRSPRANAVWATAQPRAPPVVA